MMLRARRRNAACRLTFATIAAAAALVARAPDVLADPLPAFPGADGFGANALGGRGGAVYHVTNLTDNVTTPAAGSFRAVLAQIKTDETRSVNPIPAATVVFDVGGTIPLTANLDIKNVNNVTIAGQTAPGPGINMVGFKFDVTSSSGTKANDPTSNIIVRYIASRRGNTISSANDDAIGVLGSTSDPNHNTHDVIMDHVTAAWGMDEGLSVTDSASNVTISNSFITEALQSGHQFGSLIRPRFGASVSYLGNLYANNRSRNPRPGSYNSSTLSFDFRNNTIYNWGDRAGYTGGASETGTETVNMNYIGNYLIAGPSTPSGFNTTSAFIVDTSNSSGTKDDLNISVYQSNNRIDTNRNSIADGTDTGWNAFVRYNGTTATAFAGANDSVITTTPLASPLPFAVSGSSTVDPTTAYQATLASAGAMPWSRNESDARIINQVQNNGGAILLVAPTNEWNDLVNQSAVSRPAGFDTDQDGMADSWEQARGLNPNAADNNAVVTAAESASLAGYTWLEMYLNDLALQANWAGGTSGNWDGILNWNGQLPNLQDSTAAFGNVGAAAQVSVNSIEHVGQLSLDNAAGYTLTGAGGVTMDVLSKSGGTGGYATITVTTGSHTIGVPLALASDTHFNIVPADSLLDVTGNLSATGRAITKEGDGSVRLVNVRATALAVNAGGVSIAANVLPNTSAGTSVVQSLAISPGGKLDVTNNSLVIDYTGSIGTLQSDTRQMLFDGRLTSTALAPGQALGYADNATLNRDNFSGQQVDTTSLLMMVALGGDTNLDGKVDVGDLGALATNYGTTAGAFWSQGDSNYDGKVDVGDLGALATNYGTSLVSGSASDAQMASSTATIATSVPEPCSFALIGLGAATLSYRRRRLLPGGFSL
ncbi:MAG TPA: hypothetical protein VLI90_13595 [Tepidisphaeraceae bacterium]|nr:hypothetical protein [Tepidisphaeraceae bacterium]